MCDSPVLNEFWLFPSSKRRSVLIYKSLIHFLLSFCSFLTRILDFPVKFLLYETSTYLLTLRAKKSSVRSTPTLWYVTLFT